MTLLIALTGSCLREITGDTSIFALAAARKKEEIFLPLRPCFCDPDFAKTILFVIYTTQLLKYQSNPSQVRNRRFAKAGSQNQGCCQRQ
jgi:hypothetical protein